MKVQLLVRNGMIVTPRQSYRASIAIDQGVIVAIGEDASLPAASEIVDAEGLHVLPGLVDDHVHFRQPGMTHKEDFLSGSRAAAAGGVTTVFDMPNTLPPVDRLEAFEQKRRLLAGHSYVDFALYAVITQDSVDQITPLARAGAAGFKVFMGETTGYIRCPDDGVLFEALRAVAATGLRAGAHAENDLILQHLKRKLIDQGRTDPHAHLESRPAFAEAEAISRAICISEAAGCPFHIFHLSTKEGLAHVESAQRRCLPVTAEVLVAHLLLEESAYSRYGNLIRLNPPIRSSDHTAALWDGLRRGVISAIATDHAPHTLLEKTAENVWEAASGFIGVETALPLMLTEVSKGRLSLQQYVLSNSENPARIWGVYPKKGAIQVGSDADLVLVDLQHKDVIRQSHLHSMNRITPYDGWDVQGLPRVTILRGRVIMRDGEVVGTPSGDLISPLMAGTPFRPCAGADLTDHGTVAL